MKIRAFFLTALLLALGAAAGCAADNMTSIEIAAICAPPDDATACTFSSTCDAQSIGIAAIDIGITDRLWLIVQVNNQTTNNADLGTYRTNSHDAYVEEVSTEYVAPFPIADTRQRVGPYIIPANGSSVISMFPVAPQAVATMSGVATTTPFGIVAKTKLKGHYQDQTEFETAAYEVAVEVCDGCIDPTPCTSGIAVAFCPSAGQSPASVKCE
jgi:hypothetical protein